MQYALCTDCRSLSEHCQKCSSGLTEKRVGLDIADVRAAVDAGDALLWQPTDSMVADGLTKHLPKEENLLSLALTNRYRLRYSKADSKKQRSAAAAAADPGSAAGGEPSAADPTDPGGVCVCVCQSSHPVQSVL